jgi:hypothetical protein
MPLQDLVEHDAIEEAAEADPEQDGRYLEPSTALVVELRPR